MNQDEIHEKIHARIVQAEERKLPDLLQELSLLLSTSHKSQVVELLPVEEYRNNFEMDVRRYSFIYKDIRYAVEEEVLERRFIRLSMNDEVCFSLTQAIGIKIFDVDCYLHERWEEPIREVVNKMQDEQNKSIDTEQKNYLIETAKRFGLDV